jgi:hypothetical protein
MACLESVETKDVKLSASVSVTELGCEIVPMLSITAVRIDVVSPDSLSWKGMAMTAMDSSIAIIVSNHYDILCLYMRDVPAAWWTMCISKGKYSPSIVCSLGEWKGNCFKSKLRAVSFSIF